MKKLLNKPWFVTLLALSAIVLCTWSLRDQMGSSRPKVRRPAVATAAQPTAPEEPASEGATVSGEGPLPIPAALAALVFPATIPDPFARRAANMVAGDPAAPVEVRLPDQQDSIRLTAVWHQGGVRLALVNNQIVSVGESVGRLTIDEINVEGIWVTHWRGRDFVAFGSDFTLLTPANGASAPSLALHEN